MSGRNIQDEKNEKWVTDHLPNVSILIQNYMQSKKGIHTSTTRRSYLGYLIQFEKFMKEKNIELTDVLPMHIDIYRNYIAEGNGVSIVNAKLCAVLNFYEFLLENDLVTKNPCLHKKLPVTQERKLVYMNEREEKHLKTGILLNKHRKSDRWVHRDYCIVTIGVATGLRISEITNIDVDDIDFENKVIRNVYAKGRKLREIYIGDNTIRAIRNWLDDRETLLKNKSEKALFISQKGNRIANRTVQDMLQKETENFDKKITPHKMRSTCGMKLYNKTGDIYLTAQQLGHSNLKNTMIYAQATEERKREAAKILD